MVVVGYRYSSRPALSDLSHRTSLFAFCICRPSHQSIHAATCAVTTVPRALVAANVARPTTQACATYPMRTLPTAVPTPTMAPARTATTRTTMTFKRRGCTTFQHSPRQQWWWNQSSPWLSNVMALTALQSQCSRLHQRRTSLSRRPQLACSRTTTCL